MGCRMGSGGPWGGSADVIVAVGPADQLLLIHGTLRGASAKSEELTALAVGWNGGDVLAELDLIESGEGHGWRWVVGGSLPPMHLS